MGQVGLPELLILCVLVPIVAAIVLGGVAFFVIRRGRKKPVL
jgi:hypothetical protein